MGRLTLLLDALGAVLVIAAGWLASPVIGLFIAGALCMAFAYLLEGARR